MEDKARNNDLSRTIEELSGRYEELSLLYRMTEVFTSLDLDDICSRIVNEAISTIGVQTAAILLCDKHAKSFSTKTSKGNWDHTTLSGSDYRILFKVFQKGKPSAICNLGKTEDGNDFPEFSSLMVCPVIGKARKVGVIVVADKVSGEEFFSNDLKLLMAMATLAGLAIENAYLSQDVESLMIGAIRSLVKALEASSQWTAGHTERVTEYALGIGRSLGLKGGLIDRLKITALLHDIGKIATPEAILNKDCCLAETEWEEIKKHPEKGVQILKELRDFEDIILSIKYHHEYWDGSRGIFGLQREQIPLMARILAVADAFDAMTSDRPYREKKTRSGAVEEIMRCSGTQFDPAVVDAFMRWIESITRQRSTNEF